MECILVEEKPDVVLVQVDTHIVFAGALAHPNLKASNLLLNARA